MRSPLLWSVPIAMFIASVFTPAVSAAGVNQQIQQLNTNSAQAEQKKQQLGNEAANISDTIASLQSEIATLDGQINQTAGKVDGLKADITREEAELAHQRELLGINLRVMYTDQDISTLEMLASSKTFSHFLDQNQYRESVQEKIDSTTHRIETLVTQLDTEKKSVENSLADQQAMQDNLNGRRAENARLLSMNQSQQQAFQNEMNTNNARVAALQRQQASENRKGFVSRPTTKPVIQVQKPASQPASQAPKAKSGTNYPWANAPFPNSIPDPWGMYQRQCVSYTAWKVASSGRHMPYWGGRGDAKKWDDNARASGIPVDGNPRAGDVAISNKGAYGHAMYVEAVNGDGTVTVSQYNADLRGHYSEGVRKTAGLSFIHF